jgi:hypothetical protein
MPFKKGHEKTGGRQLGSKNKATQDLKATLHEVLPEWRVKELLDGFLNSKDKQVSLRAFELSLAYMFGKPVQTVTHEEKSERWEVIDMTGLPATRNRVN